MILKKSSENCEHFVKHKNVYWVFFSRMCQQTFFESSMQIQINLHDLSFCFIREENISKFLLRLTIAGKPHKFFKEMITTVIPPETLPSKTCATSAFASPTKKPESAFVKSSRPTIARVRPFKKRGRAFLTFRVTRWQLTSQAFFTDQFARNARKNVDDDGGNGSQFTNDPRRKVERCRKKIDAWLKWLIVVPWGRTKWR